MGEEVPVDALRVWDDDHFSSVGGVDLAMDESAFLEPVDYACDGAGGQAGEFGEPSGRGWPVEQQEAERPEVRRVQPDVGYCLEVRNEQLHDEVTQVQLQIANRLVAASMTSLCWQSISIS